MMFYEVIESFVDVNLQVVDVFLRFTKKLLTIIIFHYHTRSLFF